MNSITLENISLIDADKISTWKSDRELSNLIMSNYQETSIQSAKEWITKNSADVNQKLNGIYLTEGNTKVLIGISRLMFIDFESGVCEFGIYIGSREYRGRGLGKAALDLTIDYAFNHLQLSKIYLKVLEDNLSAISLYKNRGFTIEGILKDHYNIGNRYENVICMSLFNAGNQK